MMDRAILETSKAPRPLVMGIVNVTPDSFSDGGLHAEPAAAVKRALELLRAGADIIDIGGESTRPGAAEVPVELEIARTAPVIARLREQAPAAVISIDSRKSAVAKAAVEAGADLINDVSGGLYSPDMYEVAAAAGGGYIIGHSSGNPVNMHQGTRCFYEDVVAAVIEFWQRAAERATAAGVEPENLIYDPGLGFDKTAEQCWELLRRLDELRQVGPVLVGHSRKTFIGNFLKEPDPMKRDVATLAISLYCALEGADILRVHDVGSTVEALRTQEYLNLEV